MGTPHESTYTYRALAWRRTPVAPEDASRVDLVFEPRSGPAALAAVDAHDGDTEGAAAEGVSKLKVEYEKLDVFVQDDDLEAAHEYLTRVFGFGPGTLTRTDRDSVLFPLYYRFQRGENGGGGMHGTGDFALALWGTRG